VGSQEPTRFVSAPARCPDPAGRASAEALQENLPGHSPVSARLLQDHSRRRKTHVPIASSRSSRAPLWFSLCLVAMMWPQGPANAANSPAVPAPGPTGSDARWDNTSQLRPDAILGDQTFFVGDTDPHDGNTLDFNDVDIENGYLFVATGQGMEILNLNIPGSGPVSYIYRYFRGGQFPYWSHSDKDWYIKQLDAPEGNDNIVGLTMEEQGF